MLAGEAPGPTSRGPQGEGGGPGGEVGGAGDEGVQGDDEAQGGAGHRVQVLHQLGALIHLQTTVVGFVAPDI